jgi:hypothetical protein
MNDLAREIDAPFREPPASLIRVVDRAVDAVAEAEFSCEVHGQPPGPIGEIIRLDLLDDCAAIVVRQRVGNRSLQVKTFPENQRGQEVVLSESDFPDVRRKRVYGRKGAYSWSVTGQGKLRQEDIVSLEDVRPGGFDLLAPWSEREPGS